MLGKLWLLKLMCEFVSNHEQAGNGPPSTDKSAHALSNRFIDVAGAGGYHSERDARLRIAHRAAFDTELGGPEA
ncbi:MAG TPA: hypothetical protein VFQ11_05830 [Nocardioidaceae bacterium]|jgi:hypothetical protein|nr:hypothetical protein [Nocardioidaceae bacterium]